MAGEGHIDWVCNSNIFDISFFVFIYVQAKVLNQKAMYTRDPCIASCISKIIFALNERNKLVSKAQFISGHVLFPSSATVL